VGTTNGAGDDSSGPGTSCDATLCDANENVSNHNCLPCPFGTTNDVGDDRSGPNTTCDVTLCDANEHVSNHACLPCPVGTTRVAGDDSSGPGTSCDATLCDANEHVSNHNCLPCPFGTTNDVGDDSSGPNTTCDVTLCDTNEHVSNHACLPCPVGTNHAAGDDSSGPGTSCEEITCSMLSDKQFCPEGKTILQNNTDHIGNDESSCCSAYPCSTPPPTAAYDVTELLEESLQSTTFNVSGIKCATGVTGSAEVRVCTPGNPYILQGCGDPCRTQDNCIQDHAESNCLPSAETDKIFCESAAPGYFTTNGMVETCQDVDNAASITCSNGTVSLVTTCDAGYYKVDNRGSSSDECIECPGNTTVNTNDNTMCDNTCYQWNEETVNACSSSRVLKPNSRNIVGGSVSECCDDVMCDDDSVSCTDPGNTIRNQIKRTGVCSAKTDSSRIDAQACSEADTIDDETTCNNVMKDAGTGEQERACDYTIISETRIGDDVYSSCCRDETCTDWEATNKCNGSANRYYCSELKGGETDPSETTCCISEGCPCNSLGTGYCESGYSLGTGTFDRTVHTSEQIKGLCCENPDSISTDIILSLTCEQINTICDGDQTNDGSFFEDIAEIITNGNGVISRSSDSFECTDIPSECSSCLNRDCGSGKVLTLFPSCTGGTTASPLCLDSDCCTDGQTCSSYDCSDSDGSLDPEPDSITCTGVTCTAQECCTVSRFTNMEGFQNNYPEISMGPTYLIESLENQKRFDIPITIRLEPKDNTVKLSKRDIVRIIDNGPILPTLGITIKKSTTRRNEIRKVDKKKKNKWKIIALIIGVGISVIFTLLLIISFKSQNPLLDLLS